MTDARRPGGDELERVSAALDGDGSMPDDLTDAGVAFRDAAERIRGLSRLEPAEDPPDVLPAVLHRIDEETPDPRLDVFGRVEGDEPARRRQWRWVRSVAAVVVAFAVGAASAAIVLTGDGPGGVDIALADIDDELAAAQVAVGELDAAVAIVERGAHPNVPERRYEGTLRYRPPERLWLELDDLTSYPSAAWPANDVVTVIDDDVAWRLGGVGCPIADLPGCLRSERYESVEGRAPFDPGWVAPLDIVVPRDLPTGATVEQPSPERVVVTTTVGGAGDLIGALVGTGAFRPVHVDDLVVLGLDAEWWTVESIVVRAADTDARVQWSAGTGYRDDPGATIFEITIEPTDLAVVGFPDPPAAPTADAGFVDGAVSVPVPRQLPYGFEPHRSGTVESSTGTVATTTWSDGRAWFSISERAAETQAGDILGAEVAIGAGVGYLDATGESITLLVGDRRVTVAGSLPLGDLVAVGDELDVTGRRVDGTAGLAQLPASVPRPEGVTTATPGPSGTYSVVIIEGDEVVVLVASEGQLLDPPPKGDVIEVPVRDTTGRASATLGTLAWVEAGWRIELRSDTVDIDRLRSIAVSLVVGG